MNRRSVVMAAVMAAVGFAVLTGAVAQQQRQGGGAPAAAATGPFDGKPLKEAIVGSWRLLISDGVRSDGTQVPQWGPNPKGVVIFGAGHIAIQVSKIATIAGFRSTIVDDRLRYSAPDAPPPAPKPDYKYMQGDKKKRRKKKR